MGSRPVSHTSGSGICSLLALSGQAMAQVSDTWGLQSHARKLYTLGPQVTASSCYKQTGLLKEETGLQSPLAGDYFQEKGHSTGEDSDTSQGERQEGEGRGGGKVS